MLEILAYDKRVNRYPQSFRAVIPMEIRKLAIHDGILDKEAVYLITILVYTFLY